MTVDTFIFDEDFNFILIKRKNEPFKDHWALPGGFVEYGESVETAAMREAKEETSIDVKLIDLVGVYSKPDRDQRGHTVTVAFTAKGDLSKMNADSDAKEINIFLPVFWIAANIVHYVACLFHFVGEDLLSQVAYVTRHRAKPPARPN